MAGFDLAAARALLGEVFAPWVRELGLEVVALGKDEATLRLPFSERLCREGGVICGQALMAAADTAMVFAVSAEVDPDFGTRGIVGKRAAP
jgi:acyl-coenzyme A thioesterase PaaI-like protein